MSLPVLKILNIMKLQSPAYKERRYFPPLTFRLPRLFLNCWSLNTQEDAAVITTHCCYGDFSLYKSYLSSYSNQATMFLLWNETVLVVPCNTKLLCFSKPWQPTRGKSNANSLPRKWVSYLQSQSLSLLRNSQLQNLTCFHTREKQALWEDIRSKSPPQSSHLYQKLCLVST